MKEILKRAAKKKIYKSIIAPLLPIIGMVCAVVGIILLGFGATHGGRPAAGGDTIW